MIAKERNCTSKEKYWFIFCMENILAQKFETIQDNFKKQVIQHYSFILQTPNQIYCSRWKVGILQEKRTLLYKPFWQGHWSHFAKPLGYFGIIDILFSHPVSKLGELKVWRNFWSSDDIQSHRRRSDLYSIGRVWDLSDGRKILLNKSK